MIYATEQDIVDAFGEEEFIQLTNLEAPAAIAINSTVLGKALTNASAEIDAYLQGRYVLPPTTVPTVLIQICCDIVRYRLDKNRLREDVRQRFEDAIAFLKNVAKGVVNLGLDE